MDILEYWSKRKEELNSALDITIKRGKVDVEILKTMKEILDKIRIKEISKDGQTS